MTAYDFPSARHCQVAGFDVILVGDSLGMTVLGYDNTIPVTMDDCIYHSKAVRRGAPQSFILGDMPFGSYEINTDEALRNAYRFMKEGGVDAVKIEGGGSRVHTVRRLVDSGVPVCGHIGLTPQGVNVIGGFRAQGRTASKAIKIIEDAVALQDAGAFAIVIECVPSVVAKAITEAVSIPTIGIGAGAHTSGQVLVFHDLLGFSNYTDGEPSSPSFCKSYANIGRDIHTALARYRDEVKDGLFPSDKYDTYKMSDKEMEKFGRRLHHSTESAASDVPTDDPSTRVY